MRIFPMLRSVNEGYGWGLAWNSRSGEAGDRPWATRSPRDGLCAGVDGDPSGADTMRALSRLLR